MLAGLLQGGGDPSRLVESSGGHHIVHSDVHVDVLVVAGVVEWGKVAWIELMVGQLFVDIVVTPHTISRIEQDSLRSYGVG